MAVFSCGDGVVHPMHGAGHIRALETRTVDGVEKQYYCVHLVISDLVVHVPADKEPVGLRPVCSAEEAQRLLEQWPQLALENDKYWNQRYRDNMLRIRTGEMEQVACVVKNLLYRQRKKPLSTGEKNMLESALSILISELMLALDRPYDEIRQALEPEEP